MGLDFDPIDYCRTLARAPSPYKCPVEKCSKSYKSIYGLQYHLVNYDHDTRQQITPARTPARKQKTSPAASTGGGGLANFGSPKEGLTYLEAQHVVQFEIDGKSIKVSTIEPIPMIETEDYEKLVEKGEAPPFIEPEPEPLLKLPEANSQKVENYSICDAPQRPNAYIRFVLAHTKISLILIQPEIEKIYSFQCVLDLSRKVPKSWMVKLNTMLMKKMPFGSNE